MHLIQHKREARWFYRFLSLVYERHINPFFWTEEMREASLQLAEADRPDLSVVDVGAGTGFATEGIVRIVPPERITCLDQSPEQLVRAQTKEALRGCRFLEGDAEDLPFATDSFDRYVSAGSIEYWPEPQRGIAEAYRVLKPGGIAVVMGPHRPSHRLARLIATTWMLFPETADYLTWFRSAGFVDVRFRWIRPPWVHGPTYGIAIAGRKPAAGASPLQLGPKREVTAGPPGLGEILRSLARFVIGSAAGAMFVPIAMLMTAWHRLAGRAPSSASGPIETAPRS